MCTRIGWKYGLLSVARISILMSQIDEKKKGNKKGSACLKVTCITTRYQWGFYVAFDLQLEFPELNVADFYLQSYLNVVFSYSCKYLMWFLF